MKRYIVQRFGGERDTWIDVATLDAPDPGTALQQAFAAPDHRIQAVTYRVAEEALAVNVSLNLEPANAR